MYIHKRVEAKGKKINLIFLILRFGFFLLRRVYINRINVHLFTMKRYVTRGEFVILFGLQCEEGTSAAAWIERRRGIVEAANVLQMKDEEVFCNSSNRKPSK